MISVVRNEQREAKELTVLNRRRLCVDRRLYNSELHLCEILVIRSCSYLQSFLRL